MKAKWQRPQVLGIGEAGMALGDCQQGSTATANVCSTGESTSAGSTTPHGCGNGGYASVTPSPAG